MKDPLRRSPEILRGLGLRFVVLGVAFLLWWWLTTVVWSDNPVLNGIRPSESLAAFIDIIGSSDGWMDVRTSLLRLLAGLLIAFALGLPLGLLLGSFASLERATAPVVNFLRMISPLAWAPLVIVALGVGTAPVIFLIAITALWPFTLGSAAGVRAIEPGWRNVMKSLDATRSETLRLVVVPAVRGHVVTAARLALGVAWIVLVPAEMLGVDSGLGYAVLNARDQLNYPALGGTVLLIGLIGFCLDSLFRMAIRTTA